MASKKNRVLALALIMGIAFTLLPVVYFADITGNSVSCQTNFFIALSSGKTNSYQCMSTGASSLKFSDTNSSVVIQNTINLCTGQCSILFWNGTFTIGNMPLTPKNNVLLEGQGKYLTIFKLLSGTARHILFDNIGNLFNFTVRNLGFDGNKNNQIDPTGPLARVNGELNLIAGRGNQHIYFDNVLCQNGRTGACIDLTGYDVQFTNSVVQNNGVTGAGIASDNTHFGGGNITSNARITNNLISNCTDTGIAMDNVKGSTISGNVLLNCVAGLLTLDENATSDVVTGNVFNETLYAGSWVQSIVVSGSASQNITFTGNILYCNNHTTALNVNLFLISSSKTWTISSNTISTSIENLNDFVMKLNSNNNIIVSGNTLLSNAGSTISESFIFLNGDTNFSVSQNNFYLGHFGIQFATTQASSGQVIDNSFFGTFQAIFYANHTPKTVTIKNNPGYNPIGVIANFVNTTGTLIAPFGTTSAVVASTNYTVTVTDAFITCTGGNTVSLTIGDQNGKTIVTGLATLTYTYIPVGWKLETNAFVSAPTCTAAFN